ncbi:polysaccharide biosynthesis C-terminal domain-containing protein [uncultured Chloroflexus sp.]|uniref:polysaccharide biosynthesis C-terminal domain-containing protein n=1 Tax=uncultured Chloroflexus sp. TaxID=214040 RepID=UPI0026201351|nr:polysaccharide biosynthesis C-terminal domain-containing protein [uncultured Chloroflexus sp.]
MILLLQSSRNMLQRWSLRVGFALIDQALFSGANLILNICLARWTNVTEYGAFATITAVFLILTSFYDAFVLEPMMIIGPSKYGRNFGGYLSALVLIHLLITMFFGLVLFLISRFLFPQSSLQNGMLVAGISMPVILFVWFARRAGYTIGRQGLSASVSLTYFIVLIISVMVLLTIGHLSTPTAWVCQVIAGMMSAFTFLLQTRILVIPSTTLLREVAIAHLSYSWWIVLSSVFSIGVYHVQSIVLAMLIGLDAAGAIRAISILTFPATHIISAISVLVLPVIANDFGRGDLESVRSRSFSVMGVLAIFTGIYLLGLVLFANELDIIVYGGRYTEYMGLSGVLGLIPVFSAVTLGFSLVLRAIQRPEHYLISTSISGGLGFIFSISLTSAFGLIGAAVAMIIPYLSAAIVNYLMYKKWFPKYDCSDVDRYTNS